MCEHILSGEQRRAWDAYTLRECGLSSLSLMEQAAVAFVRLFKTKITRTASVHIFVGTGNNGGDGLVVARLLHAAGYSVAVYEVGERSRATQDCRAQWAQTQSLDFPQHKLNDPHALPSFSEEEVVIDGLLGTGLSRPLRGHLAKIVEQLSDSPAFRVSIDIPSGLLADASSAARVFAADWVVTFQSPPLAFFMPENAPFVRQWSVVDIGLAAAYPTRLTTPHKLLTQKTLAGILSPLPTFLHKGRAGHALLIAGSAGMMGAALLAAKGALSSGLGRLHVHVPRGCGALVHMARPEAMVCEDEHPQFFSRTTADPTKIDAVAVGPGLGTHFPTVVALKDLLARCRRPVVLDADALNILSAHPELLALVPKNSILTPHPGEFFAVGGSVEGRL